ncbi:uncharacterized protein LOC142608709 [Castanea sativa]|uniref:uncharacterized protein LOC142608709 n=1 Tax=Castanea sativa TaxID=21020 RepID=UPI003F6516D7
MDRIDKYKRVEEDQQLGKGKGKVVPQDRRDFKLDRFNNNRPRCDFSRQFGVVAAPQAVNLLFREPVYQILEKIKNEPFFQWPNKMGGDPTRCNQSFHCQYHQERGHTTEDCRTLCGHLEQLVRGGKLKQFLYRSVGQGGQAGSRSQRDTSSKPPLGTINVILATSGRVGFYHSRVLSVAQPLEGAYYFEPKRSRTEGRPALSFSDNDKIGGYDVKRKLVDQGSWVEIMYPGLYKGLGLKLGDLTGYDSPLVGFDGKVVIPMGQIKLPVQTGSEIVDVNFIVEDVFSPYTVIVVRPWLHTMGAVSSTLHLKVKYSSDD